MAVVQTETKEVRLMRNDGDIDFDTMRPVHDDNSSDLDFETMVPVESNSGAVDVDKSDPVEGFYTSGRMEKAWNISKDIALSILPSISMPTPGRSKVPGALGVAEKAITTDLDIKPLQAAMPFGGGILEEFTEQGISEVFSRPLAALTALAKDTPFDGSGRTGVLETVYNGLSNPEKYPPQEMVTALIDSGMEPTSAAALATLGQFGFYLGSGEAMARVATTGKVGLLQGAVKNITKAITEANGQVGTTVTLNPKLAKAIAENTDVATCVDIYARSRGFKYCKNDGSMILLENKPIDIKTFTVNAAGGATKGTWVSKGGIALTPGKGQKIYIIDPTKLNPASLTKPAGVVKETDFVYTEQIPEDAIIFQKTSEGPSDLPTKKELIAAGGDVSKVNEYFFHVGDLEKGKRIRPTGGASEPPAKPPAKGSQEPAGEDPYERNSTIKDADEKAATPVRDMLNRTGARVVEEANKAFVPISTRLAKISETLKHALRKFEFRTRMRTFADLSRAEKFLNKYRKLSPKDAADLDFALKNRDTKKVDEIVKRNGMEADFTEVRALLDELHARAKDVELNIGFIEDYWPRRIADAEGFLQYLRGSENWSAIDQAVALQEEAQGYQMLDTEKAEFINKLLRGHGGTGIWLKLPANAKARLIDKITPEMNRFYKDSSQALIDYFDGMNMAIETRRFFGKEVATVDKSIGEYVRQLVDEGMIDTAQAKEVRDVLTARFNEKGTQGLWSTYKNLSYIATMNSPLNAITQIGDLAFAVYQNGLLRTGAAIFGKDLIKKEDIGIHNIAQEFSGDASTSAKAVNAVFKAIGLDKIDRIGKEALINSSFERLCNAAIKDGEALMPELETIFGDDAGRVLQDLKDKKLTEDTKYLLFSELSEFQPISHAEMPEYYLTGGNSRIFYMLKSYTLKVIDVYHNEVLREMKTDPIKGMQNFMRLTAMLVTMGVTVDWLKDFILGKVGELSDYVVNNIVKTAGFNKYVMTNARKEGTVSAFVQSMIPPTPYVDTVFSDVMGKKPIQDWKTWSKIPYVGTFYYWWFGGGAASKKKKVYVR